MLKVITLNNKKLAEEVERFASQYLRDNSVSSLYVIGIASAGVPIANIFLNSVPETVDIEVGTIRCQRPSTELKKKSDLKARLVRFLFRVSPYILLDFLRIFEHVILSKRSKKMAVRNISDESMNWRAFYSADRVLVIDDAIDSGESMKAVLDFLYAKKFKGMIDSFAVVATQPSPVVKVDYVLYENVLIRFPWSLDFKK